MTTVSAGQSTRIGAGGSAAHRLPDQFRVLLTGLLLALITVLIVDNHVMALPGGSFAEIGVARAALDDRATGRTAVQHRAPNQATAGDRAGGGPEPKDGAAPASRSGIRSMHELRRCFVQARRSGQDPATCRTRP
jgi:hypothetical protein